MGANVTFRPAVKDDALDIVELDRIAGAGLTDYVWQSYAHEHPGLSVVEIGVLGIEREDVEYSFKNCVMAEVDGQVAGMSMAFPIKAEPVTDDSDPVMRPYMELIVDGSFFVCAIAVYEAFRGQGIGAALMERVEERARECGCPSLSLLVFDVNDGAKRLYERLGYRVADRRAIVPHPLIRPEGDVLLMVRPLDQTNTQ